MTSSSAPQAQNRPASVMSIDDQRGREIGDFALEQAEAGIDVGGEGVEEGVDDADIVHRASPLDGVAGAAAPGRLWRQRPRRPAEEAAAVLRPRPRRSADLRHPGDRARCNGAARRERSSGCGVTMATTGSRTTGARGVGSIARERRDEYGDQSDDRGCAQDVRPSQHRRASVAVNMVTLPG